MGSSHQTVKPIVFSVLIQGLVDILLIEQSYKVTMVGTALDGDIIDKMRSFVESTSKFFWTDQQANITVNLWPWIVTGFLILISIPLFVTFFSNVYLPLVKFYDSYSAQSGYGRSDYDDYYDDGYDRFGSDRDRDRDFRKRRRGGRPGKSPRHEQEDDEYGYYKDDWKNNDYYKDYKDSWDRQSKELPSSVGVDMALDFSDSIANAVKMLN